MLRLNQVAQAVVPIEEEIARLSAQGLDERAVTFDTLLFMIDQAGAMADDVPVAMREAGLLDRPHASLLPSDGFVSFHRPFPREILEAFEPSFRFLVSLFRVADRRRREDCGPDCRHWWHADLGDPKVIEELRVSRPR